MCCFTGVVDDVSRTKIFARAADKGRQYLVYSMSVEAKDDLAMVLPLPVPPRSPEDAVKFINLEEYKNFFDDMLKGFPQPRSLSRGLPASGSAAPPREILKVEQVGSFEASFVPTVADFARLDKRFRLPDGTWEKLPAYKDYGFAVFKLKAGKLDVHPMAFNFPRANAKALFFPTVHIHDGEVHARADFDHELYMQPAAEGRPPRGWEESVVPAGMHMNMKKHQGILDGELHSYRRRIAGEQKNADILV